MECRAGASDPTSGPERGDSLDFSQPRFLPVKQWYLVMVAASGSLTLSLSGEADVINSRSPDGHGLGTAGACLLARLHTFEHIAHALLFIASDIGVSFTLSPC